MTTRVAIFTYNRPSLLALCSYWLLRDKPDEIDIRVYDDSSDDPDALDYLTGLFVAGIKITEVLMPGVGEKDYHQRAERCALLRRAAVDDFLESKDDYLFFKDDDVLVTGQTILEAVQDFEFLQSTDYANIGALTLHGICSHKGYQKVGDNVFAELAITGEANVLFSRRALMTVGNHLQRGKGGFADTQFKALRDGGFRYFDRVWPPYEVQHLGFGPNSSTVHREERTPIWNLQPYVVTYKRRDFGKPLVVKDFDLQTFQNTALRVGAEEAAKQYLQRLEERGREQETS